MTLIQIVGKIKDNPNWQEQMNFAQDLLIEAWENKFNIQSNSSDDNETIHIINPAIWTIQKEAKEVFIPSLLQFAAGIAETYLTTIPRTITEDTYLLYSILHILLITNKIFVLPTADINSTGSLVEVLLARRRQLPAIFMFNSDPKAIQNTLTAYLLLKSNNPSIQLWFDGSTGKLIVGSLDENKEVPSEVVNISRLIPYTPEEMKQILIENKLNETVQNFLQQQYIFLYNPKEVSYILHWNLPDFFNISQLNPNNLIVKQSN